MSAPNSAGSLVSFRPRLSADADKMFRPDLTNMVVTDGHKLRMWREGKGNRTSHKLVSIVGQQVSNLLAPGFKKLDVLDTDAKLQMDMLNKLAFTGSYVTMGDDKRPVLTYVEDDDYFYLKFASGFIPNEVLVSEGGRDRRVLETESDFLELVRRDIQPVSHGFHSLGGANSVLATESGLDFATTETKRLWSSVGKDRVFGTDIPHMRTDLIKISKRNGAAGMFQDIDGSRGRLVVEKGALIVVDASGPNYDTFWKAAESRRRTAAAARREANRLKKGVPAEPDLFKSTETVEIEEPAPATA